MKTKLQAAELATSQGTAVLVTNGSRPESLYDVIDGKKIGTLFAVRKG